MVSENVLISFFYSCPVFPASLIKEIVFSPLYIFASFVKDKVSIGACIYLWAFYFVPLIYISVFVPVPTVLMTVAEQEFNKTITNDLLLRTECTGIALFLVIY